MTPSRRGRTTLWELEPRRGLPLEAGVTEEIQSLFEELLRTATGVKHLAFQNGTSWPPTSCQASHSFRSQRTREPGKYHFRGLAPVLQSRAGGKALKDKYQRLVWGSC